MRHVDSYLVRPAGFKPAADMRKTIVPRHDLIVRHGLARIRFSNSLALPVRRVAAYRSVDGAFVVPHPAAYHRLVNPCECVVGQLCGQCAVRGIVFRSDDKS